MGHYACLSGDVTAVSLLIKANATLDVQDAQSETPLRLAIEEDRADIIETLFQSRADVNHVNMESGLQYTLLMDAAHQGKHELARILISANASINKQGKHGMTAL